MSSSEQAPEPTMDEILASIRKIISDDEPGDAPQPEVASPEQETAQAAPAPAAPAAPAAPVAADPAPAEGGLAEDIANALNDTQAEAGDVDDILDLTKIVENQPQAAEAPQQTPQGDALQSAGGDLAEAAAVSQPAPERQPAQAEANEAAGDIDIASLLAEAGVEDTVSEDAASAPPAAPAGDDLAAILDQGNEAAAPAEESAAISEALSAMAPPASDPVADAPVTDSPVTNAEVEAAAPEAAMTQSEPAEAAPAPAEASLDAGAASPAVSEADVVAQAPEIPEVAEIEAAAPAPEDASFEAPGDMSADTAGVAESTPLAEPAIEPEAPVEDVAAIAAAAPALEQAAPVEEPAQGADDEAGPADSSAKSLEDSVKEVLRPMLRQWMDDNLERIVQSEVASGKIKGQDN